MNAANPSERMALDEAMPVGQRPPEPSMEEILASIRRIITDDDVLPLASHGGPRLVEPAEAEPAPAVAPPMLTLATPPHAFVKPTQELVADPFEAALDAAAEPGRHSSSHDEPGQYGHHDSASIVSADTSVAVHASFEALAATVMAQNTAMIEESIRTMLRPMLKTWLDDNLPVIVERLVRAEIERVARGGR